MLSELPRMGGGSNSNNPHSSSVSSGLGSVDEDTELLQPTLENENATILHLKSGSPGFGPMSPDENNPMNETNINTTNNTYRYT